MNAVPARMPAGFVDPVIDGQAVFRSLMDAMARPGVIRAAGAALDAPAPLMTASAAILLALCDFETKLHVSPAMAEAAPYLRFHTGAPLVGEPGQGAFALVDARREPLALAAFAQGDPAYPDRSTTVIAQVESLAAGESLSIAGPGIAGVGTLRVSSLPADFRAQWAANRAAFPLGVDLVFVAGTQFVALPRSARILDGAA